jgi:hypothetical protein
MFKKTLKGRFAPPALSTSLRRRRRRRRRKVYSKLTQ